MRTCLFPRILFFVAISLCTSATSQAACQSRQLKFSADNLPGLPSSSAFVWGGNATEGGDHTDPPFSPAFLAQARAAKNRGMKVFAYLEGPCGDTNNKDDGERARCAELHQAFNQEFAQDTEDSAEERWKPFTFQQLRLSGKYKIDYCEIDNLKNNVEVPLIPLLREIKGLYDAGEVHCRLVLKNISTRELQSIKASVAPSPAAANFLAPFHIYEADDESEKDALDVAMRRLKGSGAVTIISTDTENYGSQFTDDSFLSCD